jgi:hypothetical protein
MDKLYQFITITYNQAHLIEEHLNSIKTQIVKYAGTKYVKLTLIDDCSTDKNVDVVNNWVKLNSKLFYSVEILQNKVNLGIKENFLYACSKIVTPSYKLLAGDDLYIENSNIFDFMEQSSDNHVVFSPVELKGYSKLRLKLGFYRLFFFKRFRRLLRIVLNEVNLFSAPGSYVYHSLLVDKDYLNYMKNSPEAYEDWPTWKFLFIENSYEFKLIEKKYVQYRPQNNSARSNKFFKNRKNLGYIKYFNPSKFPALVIIAISYLYSILHILIRSHSVD